MVSGFVNNESESLISYSLTRKAGEAKDTYAITPSGAESQDNYSVTYESGALAINATEINPDTPDPNDPTNPDAKRFTISNPADVVCNGLSQKDEVTVHDAATGKDLELGTDYTLSYSEDTTNVGTVTVTVNGTGNYSGTVAQTYQITPATLTVTTPSDSKSYDGTPLTAQGTITGFVNPRPRPSWPPAARPRLASLITPTCSPSTRRPRRATALSPRASASLKLRQATSLMPIPSR